MAVVCRLSLDLRTRLVGREHRKDLPRARHPRHPPRHPPHLLRECPPPAPALSDSPLTHTPAPPGRRIVRHRTHARRPHRVHLRARRPARRRSSQRRLRARHAAHGPARRALAAARPARHRRAAGLAGLLHGRRRDRAPRGRRRVLARGEPAGLAGAQPAHGVGGKGRGRGRGGGRGAAGGGGRGRGRARCVAEYVGLEHRREHERGGVVCAAGARREL
ncbi:hypothetical protein FA95DRAFT_1096247 [Auriscalpium vulgare]|uniref:Uncharacterized protein n=1 Tax=Auriscalpium vulgare TaxID=40419 RepID=A0ACB8RWS1_9AGAM|nr:hypothetical protein FA95DRAFT_1096247 [Auriscalpium vulgare]